MRGQEVPEQDRGLQAMSSRRMRAIWKIFWMIVGIIAAGVLLYLDIFYSADGMIPVFGDTEISTYLCWAISIIMSPIELAGTAIAADRFMKKELSNDAKWIIQIVVWLVFAADVVTNWMGLYEQAVSAGVSIATFHYMLIGVVGTFLAFIEYMIDAFVTILSKELGNFKQANTWMQEWESRQGGGPSSGPSRGGPHRAPPMPMAAHGRDGGPRREPPRRDSGRPPTRRAM